MAAVGLFVAGAVVSIWHGVTSLFAGESGSENYTVAYIVLAVGSILVGVLPAVVAFVLIGRNRRFLTGEPGSRALWEAVVSNRRSRAHSGDWSVSKETNNAVVDAVLTVAEPDEGDRGKTGLVEPRSM